MAEQLLIRGARILSPANGIDQIGDLLVQDGIIAKIGDNLTEPNASIIEAQGLVAAPGLVDMHVHLRDPGFTQKEDILSGCRAAAAGGVTSLLAMPNTNPVTDTPEVAKDILSRAEQADARVYVTAAITTGLRSEALTDLPALKAAGVTAISDDGRPVTDTRLMAEGMKQAALLGMRVVSHCEDLFLAAGGLMNEGNISRQLGVPGIPAAAEECGTARDIALAESYGVPIHICHVSTAVAAAMIRDAKKRGVQVTAETAPHYFSLTEEALLTRSGDFRMNPPLRTEQDLHAIRKALCDGTIDAIATDHAPHTPQEKADFLTAPNGSIGMETSLAVGITYLVQTDRLTLSQLIEKMSVIPARILGIPGGILQQGAPADIVLFNETERFTVDPNTLHGKSRNTPFAGMELSGKVKYTICRGKVVYQEA
ncbi:dihydroorotase [Clostridium merdae]|uniref:dihydroorotase n=1 Tax=Clostridium merdae TaxID=1958780 RepID=UPI000A26EC6E|nr:dihydroorotase [Clostridium merdae]